MTYENNKQDKDTQKLVGTLFNAIGGLSGLSAIATLFVWGGRLDNRMTHAETAVTKLEIEGPAPHQMKLIKLETRLDQRDEIEKDVLRRLDKIETLETSMARMSGQLEVIGAKIDGLSDRIKKVEK